MLRGSSHEVHWEHTKKERKYGQDDEQQMDAYNREREPDYAVLNGYVFDFECAGTRHRLRLTDRFGR